MKKLERLRAGVERLAADVPLYRVRFGETGIDARNIRSFEELARLPFTTKADLRNNYPHLASRFYVRVRIEDNPSDVLRLGESAVVLIHDKTPREPGI
jgi:phenylacetate-coenzyme A ligase PaaK-like adenylate-forming protein